ncbi:MAG: c-type cytochrome [Acidobacteria bacterium]|nr:c-type cytochrome [Acidobacteriota bacterium]
MKLRRIVFSFFSICVLSLLPFAFYARPQPNLQANIEAGRKLYVGSCSNTYCHGITGTGGGGPKLKDREFTPEYLTGVIGGGISGTGMPGFNKRYNQDQIAQIVAYVLSLSPNNPNLKDVNPSSSGEEHFGKTPPKPESPAVPASKPTEPGESADLMGDASSGREIFFDATQTQNCRVCHTVQGIGGKVGPDLSGIAGKSPREILRSIVAAHAEVSEKYSTIVITTTKGERFTGVKRDENEQMIRLFDTATLPPVSRAFLKSEVAKIETLKTSSMPGDFGRRYSFKQLLDLISFLKTTDPAKPVSVGLKDL